MFEKWYDDRTVFEIAREDGELAPDWGIDPAAEFCTCGCGQLWKDCPEPKR